MDEDNRITLNDIKVYPFTSFGEVIDFAFARKGILVAINAEKIMNATDRTRNIINSNIGYADGAGTVLALKKHGSKNAVKLAGCELWLKIIATRYQKGDRFYLVGSRQEVIEQTVARLREDFPGICIVGYRNGYFAPGDEERLLDDIAEKKPDIVFVAMGSPRQEFLMEAMQKRHTAVYQGLGGSFDVYSGFQKRAPKWWINHNLEFAYRLLSQPRRVKRQLRLLRYFFRVMTRQI